MNIAIVFVFDVYQIINYLIQLDLKFLLKSLYPKLFTFLTLEPDLAIC